MTRACPTSTNACCSFSAAATPAGSRRKEEADLQAELVAQFPLLEDADGSTFDAYRSNGVPTTYLLDAEGKVAGTGVGEPEGVKLVRTLAADILGPKGNR